MKSFIILICLLKIFIIKTLSNKCFKNLFNNNSEIRIIIQGKGTQKILGDRFTGQPNLIKINGESKDCTKTCKLEEDINNIVLTFGSQLTSLKYMFYNIQNLKEVDFTNFDTSKVENMEYMFAECYSLKSINFANINTKSVKKISRLFLNCKNLTYLDLSLLDFSNVQDMSGMFSSCGKLENITFGNINASSLEDMHNLFEGCSILESIDLSVFDAIKVKDISSMFSGCKYLKTINFGLFNTSSVEDMGGLFCDCENLTSIDLSNFDTTKVKDISFMFSGCNNLEVINLSNFNTQSVTKMGALFQSCSKLISLDLSNFDFSNVESISFMLSGCSKLEKVNFGNINTSSVNNMNTLFQACLKLTEIDLTNFDFSKVTDISNMFVNCYSLQKIDFGNSNLSSLKKMISLFEGCSQLTSIDLSTFNTSQVTDFTRIFSGCSKLKYLDLSHFNTEKITTIDYMFYNCKSLLYLDIRYFKLNNSVSRIESFVGLSSNIKFCINDEDTSNLLLGNESVSICYDECYHGKSDKIYLLNERCLEFCKILGYEYEYNNVCYKECPQGSYFLSCDENNCDNNLKKCLAKVAQSYYLDLSDLTKSIDIINPINKTCYETCKFCKGKGNETFHNCTECKSDFIFVDNPRYRTNCYKKYRYSYYFDENNTYQCNEIYNEKEDREKQDNILRNIQNNIYKLNTTDIDRGIDMAYFKEKTTYTITSTKNQKNNKDNNVSTIDLGECETKLKLAYNISINDSLYIFKVDVWIDNMLKIEYEVYYPFIIGNLSKLDLNFCKDTKLRLAIPRDINIDELDKYNISSDIYNDICYTLTNENGTDKPLKERQKEFVNNNMS